MTLRLPSFALCCALAGCGKTDSTPAATASIPAPGPSAIPAAASTPAPSASAAEPAPTATKPLKKVSAKAKRVDTSDWNGAPPGSTLELVWTADRTKAVLPVKSDLRDDLTKHKVPLDLILTLNGRPHAIALETNAGHASASSCPEVSFFWAGINIRFQVERAEEGRAVLTRTWTSESADTKVEQLYVFDVPADVKIAQELIKVDPDGKRTSTKCAAPRFPIEP